jgi:hypothetical protein
VKIRALLLVALVSTSVACWNVNRSQNITADNRFEVATGSLVLGARQLLVDTSNGDVWMLDGDRAPEARWVLLSRGPEDVRELQPVEDPSEEDE